MKRSYPYSGPAGGQQPQQAAGVGVGGMQSDYSAYGYGATQQANQNSSNATNDAQQARWHQQWQQYYAQQAAAASGAPPNQNNGPINHQSMSPPQQPPPSSQSYPYNNMPMTGPPMAAAQQQQQQSPAAYYGQYSSQQQQQQPLAGPPSSSYGWNQPGYGPPSAQPQANVYMHPPVPAGVPPPASTAPQAGYYGNTTNQNNLPPAKRQRTGGGHGMAGAQSGSIPPRPSQHQGRFSGQGNSRTSSAPQHPIPGRPSVGMNITPNVGGPSNMAGPMAGGNVNHSSSAPRSFSGNSNRGSRNQNHHQQHSSGRSQNDRRGSSNHSNGSSASTSNSKFNGPMGGVNAVGPISGVSRSGFGQQRQQQSMRKFPSVPTRNGSGNHANQSNKSNRNENNRNTKGSNASSKGNAAGDKSVNEDSMELTKAPLLQGHSTSAIEHPVPITSKRTYTDFDIHSIEIEPIQWIWQRPEDEEVEATKDETEKGGGGVQDKSVTNKTDESGKKSNTRYSRKRNDHGRDFFRLRFTFTANAPPAGAPTGPKALAKPNKETVEDAENDGKDVELKDSEQDPERHEDEDKKWSPLSRSPPHLSPNRITLSYAMATRRITLDANVIKSVEVNRAQGTVRIVIDLTTANDLDVSSKHDDLRTAAEPSSTNIQPSSEKKGKEWVLAKGVLLEARNNSTGPFFIVNRRELEDCWREKRNFRQWAENDSKDANVDDLKKKGDDQDHSRQQEGDDTNSIKTGKQKEVIKAEGEETVDEFLRKVKVEVEAATADEETEMEGQKGKVENMNPRSNVLHTFENIPPLYRFLLHHNGPEKELDESMMKSITNSKEMTILVTLRDSSSSAKEARWIRNGDLREWLSALPGMQSSITTEPLNEWISKMHIIDPDPPPTLSDVYDEWVKKSFIATALQRRNFLHDYQMDSITGLTELMARMVNVQSERSHNITTPGEKELTRTLLDIAKETLFDAHHSHLSLSVWKLVNLMHQFAQTENQKFEALNVLKEIVLSTPLVIISRALDGLCKEANDKQRLQSTLSRRKQQQQQQQQNSSQPSHLKNVEENANGENTPSNIPSSPTNSIRQPPSEVNADRIESKGLVRNNVLEDSSREQEETLDGEDEGDDDDGDLVDDDDGYNNEEDVHDDDDEEDHMTQEAADNEDDNVAAQDSISQENSSSKESKE